MKKYIEKLFAPTLTAIEDTFQDQYGDFGVPAEYQRYIAGFGADVAQMGLLPTLAVYADKGSASARDKGALLRILQTVLRSDASDFPYKDRILDDTDLFRAAVAMNDKQRGELRRHILYVAVSVKLCIRTFKTFRSHERT